jgi:hypothetical protein
MISYRFFSNYLVILFKLVVGSLLADCERGLFKA